VTDLTVVSGGDGHSDGGDGGDGDGGGDGGGDGDGGGGGGGDGGSLYVAHQLASQLKAKQLFQLKALLQFSSRQIEFELYLFTRGWIQCSG